MRALVAVLPSLLVLAVAPAAADAQWIVWQAPAGEGERARALAAELSARGVHATLDPMPEIVELGADVGEDEIDWLATVDEELAQARREVAALEEPSALARIEAVLAQGLERPHVPGVAARRVEALLLRAVVRTQRGEPSSEDFAEVARLDPERRLAAAEAPPAVREQAEQARALALGATAVFAIETEPPGAEVFLDDTPLGPAPVRVGPIPVGRHALRVEAPGHATYGDWLEVPAGERAPVRVRLTPVAELDALRLGLAALREGSGPVEARAPWGWLLVVAGRAGRAAVRGCTATLGRCGPWERAEAGRPAPSPPEASALRRTEDALATDASTARWLEGPRARRRPRRPTPTTPWYRRPWLWVTAAAVVGAAGVTAGVVAGSAGGATPRRSFVIELDPDER